MPGLSICLIILDIWQGFQYASGIKYSRFLNMPSYSYNNIIFIITNAIILEFLTAQFVHPGALQLTVLFFSHKLELENNFEFWYNNSQNNFENIFFKDFLGSPLRTFGDFKVWPCCICSQLITYWYTDLVVLNSSQQSTLQSSSQLAFKKVL